MHAHKQPSLRYNLLLGEDLISMPPMRWMIRGILPTEGLAAIYGPSMSGKSFLALDLAFAIAGGEEQWFDYRVVQAPVTYICLEGESGFSKRLKAWKQHYDKIVPEEIKFLMQPFNLLSNDIDDLAEAITANNDQNGLVVIDTLNRAAQGMDENSSTDMGRVISKAKRLQDMVGGLILLVHHTGKTVDKGPRGHSSLFAALDGGIETIRTSNPREWRIAKSKDDVSGTTHCFKLDIVDLGEDDEGETVTSCVVTPSDSLHATIERVIQPKSTNQKIVFNAIHTLLSNTQEFGKASAPEGRPCIHFNDALDTAKRKLPVEDKRKTERAKSAILGLVAKQYFMHEDGWIWTTG